MKIFFIVLGVTIALSALALFAALTGLIFAAWQPLLPGIKTLFIWLVSLCAIFAVTLLVIPHGRKN